MKHRFGRSTACVIVLWLTACGGGGNGTVDPAGTASPQVALVEAFPGLAFVNPVALRQHPDDPQRWYVVERDGLILTFAGAETGATDIFLNVSDKVAPQGEGGLLGIAFHPEFSRNGQVYVNYTIEGPGPEAPLTTHIARFTSPDGGLTAGGEEILLRIDQPFANHNGGWIGFDPDGYLYIALGDGGGAGDPEENAQNTHTLLGSMLRIDVDGIDPPRPYAIPANNPFVASAACGEGMGCPEIFAWGLRNPWRGSFDAVTGDLWVADVGQGMWEEIDRMVAGANYGWPILEGNHCFQADACDTTGLTPPVSEYDHSVGGSVTGGYVYRGSDIPDLNGDYIYGDFISGRIWRLVGAAAGGNQPELLIESGLMVVSFAQDGAGEVYVIDFADGIIYRLAPATGPAA